MRILRVADIPNNRTGGMSRTMYCTGEVLAAEGQMVSAMAPIALVSDTLEEALAGLRARAPRLSEFAAAAAGCAGT